MLAEFFLTPEVFCESDEGLRRLQNCLFPFNNPPIGVICHFGEKEWEAVISHRIVRIQNQNRRNLAMNLFRKICGELAVDRPPAATPPDDENGWVTKAKESSRDLPLDGFVISQGITDCPADCTRLKDFSLPQFWENFSNPRLVGRDTASQVTVLNSVCAHSDWLIVRMPQVKGGSDDEIVTIKQIIQLANRLPADYKKSDVIVEVPLPENLERKYGEIDGAKRLMRMVKDALADEKVSGADISVAIYPKGSFINREIVAGEFAYDSDKNEIFKARWYLTMNHVAVGGRDAASRDDSNSWNLYSRADAAKRLGELSLLEPVIPQEIV